LLKSRNLLSISLTLKNQIVCLEHQGNKLFGEVIQLIPHRNLCWFRPICLVISNDREGQTSFELDCIDLQSTSDLFWPANLFRPALDTEAISFLAQLNDLRHHSIGITSKNYKYLHEFIQQFWQENQAQFLV
jgi:hypothetical protein